MNDPCHGYRVGDVFVYQKEDRWYVTQCNAQGLWLNHKGYMTDAHDQLPTWNYFTAASVRRPNATYWDYIPAFPQHIALPDGV